MSFVALGAFGLALLSQWAAGLIAEAVGPATLFVAAGLLLGTAALGGLLSPALRELDIRPPPAALARRVRHGRA